MKNIFYTSAIMLCLTSPAFAADVVIDIKNIQSNEGEIGCALFANANGFPMESPKSAQQWQKANKSGMQCKFENVKSGSYAVSVVHDLNRNYKTDTNFVGIPTEAWGVSNNARPSLRALTFDEAKFEVDGQKNTTIIVEIE
jgi:uncharacterized protein (DUF2141 family)